MARLNQGGVLSGVKDEDMHKGGGVRESMPKGWYRVVVKDSAYKPCNGGMGLHLFLTCLQAPYHGRDLYDFGVLEHTSAQAVQIAKAKLKELAIAVGHPNPNRVMDSSELHNIPVFAYVSTQAANDPKYGDSQGLQNRITEYRSKDDPEVAAKLNGSGAAAGSDEPPTPSEAYAPSRPDDSEVPF